MCVGGGGAKGSCRGWFPVTHPQPSKGPPSAAWPPGSSERPWRGDGCVAGEQVRTRPDLAGGPLSVTFPSDCADFGRLARACLFGATVAWFFTTTPSEVARSSVCSLRGDDRRPCCCRPPSLPPPPTRPQSDLFQVSASQPRAAATLTAG